MNRKTCPVCKNEISEKERKYCKVCTWDFRGDIEAFDTVVPATEGEVEIFRERLKKAQEWWNDFQNAVKSNMQMKEQIDVINYKWRQEFEKWEKEKEALISRLQSKGEKSDSQFHEIVDKLSSTLKECEKLKKEKVELTDGYNSKLKSMESEITNSKQAASTVQVRLSRLEGEIRKGRCLNSSCQRFMSSMDAVGKYCTCCGKKLKPITQSDRAFLGGNLLK